MPRRRPPGRPAITTSIFLHLLPLITVAQQQRPQESFHHQKHAVNTILPRGRSTHVEVGRNSNNHQRENEYNKHSELAAQNVRALVTLASAPAVSDAAVRAPSKPAVGPSGGLSSRPRARSLQDWQVEDFVLLATVDGQIHARDRDTGKERWAFSVGRPMVETTYDYQSISEEDPEGDKFGKTPLWIVEPSQDGSLYVYSHGSTGIQKLGMTVRGLAEELSPYASEDPPVVYTAEKRTTLYTVDARTGTILKRFSSGGSSIFNDTNCEKLNDFVSSSNKECKGTLTLGQTEYVVAIQSRDTGRPICTIKYFEWTPNLRDKDLHSQYLSTMDNKYVYSKYDGTVFALDHTTHRKIYPQRPVYTRKFSSPVVRVFDVARPYQDESDDPALIILPQPVGPASAEELVQDVWVNCTESGTWYAMSEYSYPAVTDGASKARCYTLDSPGISDGHQVVPETKAIVGVHSLAAQGEYSSTDYPTISAPEVGNGAAIEVPSPPSVSPNEGGSIPMPRQKPSWVAPAMAGVIVVLLIPWLVPTSRLNRTLTQLTKILLTNEKAHPQIAVTVTETQPQSEPQPEVQLQAEAQEKPAEPALELVPEPAPKTILEAASVEERRVRFAEPDELSEEDTPLSRVTSVGDQSVGEVSEMTPEANAETNAQVIDVTGEGGVSTESAEAGPETPKKKKAHRGQRGGKKRRKNSTKATDETQDEVAKIVEQVKKIGTAQPPVQPDALSYSGESMTDIANNIKRLGKLTIFTDKVIGNGSGGTFVFEGKWKEREVAVKRMLPQYYGLAEQEVSLLQQSDLHPNVIRYFDDEKDQDFLWIALELCQSSLWDLFKDGHHDDPLHSAQAALVTEINSDVPRALYQLAAGLNHLHNLRIIHRDIKPQNILIAYPQKNQKGGPRLVISDFGLCKTLPDNVSTLVGTTTNAGTIGWKAPELIAQPKEIEGRNSSTTGHSRDSSSSTDPVAQGVKRAVDIFSLGCVFYYVLTNGSHPFDDKEEGWMQLRELNIKKNKLNFSDLDYLGDDIEEPIDLLYGMLAPLPEDRPTAQHVMMHPFFWSAEKRLAFLCDVSDHWEREPRGEPTNPDGTPVLAKGKTVVNDGGPSQDLLQLESHAEMIICSSMNSGRVPDFLSRLDKNFRDSLGKQRKYQGHKLLDLLRALRNKKNHYEDMPPEVKAKVGPLPHGYLRFWTSKFPKLLIECYHCVLECGLHDKDRFKPYFTIAE